MKFDTVTEATEESMDPMAYALDHGISIHAVHFENGKFVTSVFDVEDVGGTYIISYRVGVKAIRIIVRGSSIVLVEPHRDQERGYDNR